MIKATEKWIKFKEIIPIQIRKTKIFEVQNKDSGICIGVIKWYGAWRQYSFFPSANCVFERQCLIDITRFIHHLMLDRKILNNKQK